MTTPPQSLSLAGTSTSSGLMVAVLRLITQVAFTGGRSVGTGAIELLQSIVPGSFADFALVPTGQSTVADPAFAHVTSAQIRLGGAPDVSFEWRRLWLTTTAPRSAYIPGPAGLIYSGFEYGRLGIQLDALAVGDLHKIAYVQFEQTPGGVDPDTDQFGSNLFDLEQSSYEGRMMYEPIGGGETASMTFTRTEERASCGQFSGKFVYQSPPATNSYAAVAQFGSYSNLRSRRQTYADVKYRAFEPGEGLPDNPLGTGEVGGDPIPAPAVVTLRPLSTALVRVEPGVTYQAQVSLAAETAGESFACAVLLYEEDLTPIGGPSVGPAEITEGDYQWQTASHTVFITDEIRWAAVVPRLSTSGAARVQYYVDEHRMWVPSTLATEKFGKSPARPWQPPRELIVRLRATRVNYCQNPSFQNSAWGWNQVKDASVTSSLTLAAGGGITGNAGSFRIETVPTATLVNGTSPRTGVVASTQQPALVDRLKPDTVYTASLYVRPMASPVPVTVWAHDGEQLVRGTSTPIVDTSSGETWYRISVTFKAASTFGGTLPLTVGYAAGDVARVFAAVPPGSNEDIWLLLPQEPGVEPSWSQSSTYAAGALVQHDGFLWEALVENGPYANIGPLEFRWDHLLVEEADVVAPFFDGNEPSGDYLWEGAVGDSRSHYYRGKRANQYRLDQIIRRQIGVGASYRIVYAAAP
jgi:hypothetical protein